MNLLSTILAPATILLQLALVVFLARGPFQKYVVFSLYVVFALAANLIDGIFYFRSGWRSVAYYKIFWTDHITLDLLLFVLVIAFTYEALGENPLRPKAGKVLGAIVAVALVLPFVFLPDHHSKQNGFFTNRWFMNVSQIWNFGAAIMNLVLWTALLSNRRRDPKLVSLSIGVGLLTTSAAIAWGARQWLAEGNRWMVDAFMTVADLAALLIWCSVFRPRPEAPTKPTSNAPPPNALASHS